MNNPNIQIILGSTRRERQGEKVAKWLASLASQRSDFSSELIDLRDWPLPFFEEPQSPSALKIDDYSSEIAKKWHQKISAGDGFVIITPEYNHGYPAVLKNALDYLNAPWNKKPVAFVSYSTGSVAGARAVEQLRQVSIDLEMVPIRSAIHLSTVDKLFNKQGQIKDESYNKRAGKLFDSLLWWTNLLKQARK